ncbi:MAG: hypothetical protein AAF411_24295 [Myxococcota bacterium]
MDAFDAAQSDGGAMCAPMGGDCSRGDTCCAGLRCELGRTCVEDVLPDMGTMSTPDAATPAPDAGVPTPDAATPAPDAGTPAPDAGAPMPDAGAPMPDAGMPAPDSGGACLPERADCTTGACCADFVCTPTDRGMECRVPRTGT